MKFFSLPVYILLLGLMTTSCNPESLNPGVEPDELTDKSIIFRFQVDAEQERLDNFGRPSTMPYGHAALTPAFKAISAHFIEFVPTETTPYKFGATVFQGVEMSANNPNGYGFSTAIDFEKSVIAGEREVFLEVPISEIEAGTYKHIRVSVTYQNYDVKFNLLNVPGIGSLMQQGGTFASFVGYNSYIKKHLINEMEMDVNDFKLQGFWGFETHLAAPYSSFNRVITGQAPADATTVVNPFSSKAPIPQGSCVVSGSFDSPLVITGKEQEDIEITLSVSINKSFEWEDKNGNNEWDIDFANPSTPEPVVDMGLRGLKAFTNK